MNAAGGGGGKPAPAEGALHTYLRLLSYVRPYRGHFALALLGGLVYSAVMGSIGYWAKSLGDNTIVDRDPRTITWVPVILVGLFILRGLGDFTQTYFMGYVGRRVVTRLRGEVFRRVLQFPISYFDRNSAGALLSRLTYNTEQIGSATTDAVTSVVTTTLTILGSIGYLLWLNARLALFALTIGPLMGWLITVINRRFRRYSRRIPDSVGDVEHRHGHLLEHLESLAGIREGDVLGSGHDDGAGDRYALCEGELNVARTRGHVDDQVIEISPMCFRQELCEGLRDHRSTPHHRLFRIDQEADRHRADAMAHHRL